VCFHDFEGFYVLTLFPKGFSEFSPDSKIKESSKLEKRRNTAFEKWGYLPEKLIQNKKGVKITLNTYLVF